MLTGISWVVHVRGLSCNCGPVSAGCIRCLDIHVLTASDNYQLGAQLGLSTKVTVRSFSTCLELLSAWRLDSKTDQPKSKHSKRPRPHGKVDLFLPNYPLFRRSGSLSSHSITKPPLTPLGQIKDLCFTLLLSCSLLVFITSAISMHFTMNIWLMSVSSLDCEFLEGQGNQSFCSSLYLQCPP